MAEGMGWSVVKWNELRSLRLEENSGELFSGSRPAAPPSRPALLNVLVFLLRSEVSAMPCVLRCRRQSRNATSSAMATKASAPITAPAIVPPDGPDDDFCFCEKSVLLVDAGVETIICVVTTPATIYVLVTTLAGVVEGEFVSGDCVVLRED